MKKKLLTAGLAALMLAGCTGTKKIELTPDGTAFNASALDTAKAVQKALPSDAKATLDTSNDYPGIDIVGSSGDETSIVVWDKYDKSRVDAINISAIIPTSKNDQSVKDYYMYELPKTVLKTLDIDDAEGLAKAAYRDSVTHYTYGSAEVDGIKCAVSQQATDDGFVYMTVIAPETGSFWEY
ncbi:hypothetical protein [Faecalibaculum rodentium]|uniref:hypothetical protein n=1 Tax=Faecalibaculum rodentium TaxID=1702221 RepID=UPI0023F42219|nr:hypothetical protein [Faecalibaculum rodentium]